MRDLVVVYPTVLAEASTMGRVVVSITDQVAVCTTALVEASTLDQVVVFTWDLAAASMSVRRLPMDIMALGDHALLGRWVRIGPSKTARLKAQVPCT